MQRNAKSKWPSFERSARQGKTLHKPLAIRFTSAIGFRNPQTLEKPSGAGGLRNRAQLVVVWIRSRSVVLPDVPVRAVKQIDVLVELVFEECLA